MQSTTRSPAARDESAQAGFAQNPEVSKTKSRGSPNGTSHARGPLTPGCSKGSRLAARYFVNTSAMTLLDGSTITSLWPTIAKSYGCSAGTSAATLLGIGLSFTVFGMKVPIVA
jgi:hypothetical protein